MACLDTSVMVDLSGRGGARRRAAARALVAEKLRRAEVLTTTRVSEAEMRVGLYRSKDPALEQQRIDEVLAWIVVLELDPAAADRYGAVKGHLWSLGRPAGDLDTMIAAICLANSETLITHNVRHFADVPGLVVESY